IWSGRPQRGPTAPLGNYKVRMTTGSYSQTHPFTIKINPNLEEVTEADLKAQFDLAMKIRDKESAANEAVIKIRNIRKQVNARLDEAKDQQLTDASKPLLEK
ncbi:MAG: hypothetical protein HC811_14405, partial [Flammeovirgaceae bacterium]|nr:hypothetical protein [Flammeovirgaceae bacterium]